MACCLYHLGSTPNGKKPSTDCEYKLAEKPDRCTAMGSQVKPVCQQLPKTMSTTSAQMFGHTIESSENSLAIDTSCVKVCRLRSQRKHA
ncbi:MAG: hypothetical protein ACI9QQ_002431 [Myxococcota bacterium]|jgi:hypothetical protein